MQEKYHYWVGLNVEPDDEDEDKCFPFAFTSLYFLEIIFKNIDRIDPLNYHEILSCPHCPQ